MLYKCGIITITTSESFSECFCQFSGVVLWCGPLWLLNTGNNVCLFLFRCYYNTGNQEAQVSQAMLRALLQFWTQEFSMQSPSTWFQGRLRGVRRSCWRPSWSGSCWCTRPASWGRCGSWSAGQCWRPTAVRWTAPSSCSAGAWAAGWRNATLHKRDPIKVLEMAEVSPRSFSVWFCSRSSVGPATKAMDSRWSFSRNEMLINCF